ncbi:hypothetical protein CsatB_015116 [Cannabis sativa]
MWTMGDDFQYQYGKVDSLCQQGRAGGLMCCIQHLLSALMQNLQQMRLGH